MATISDELGRTLYREARMHCTDLRREVTRLQARLVTVEAELRKEEHLCAATSSNICTHCDGEGKCWISYDQDDTKLESCKYCTGTGFATTRSKV